MYFEKSKELAIWNWRSVFYLQENYLLCAKFEKKRKACFAYILCLPISLKNISSSLLSIACCCVVCSLLPSSPLRTPSRAARLGSQIQCQDPSHATPFIAAPCSISRRARARSSSLHAVPPLLRTVTRPPRTLRCCHSPPEGRARYRRHGRCDARPQQWDVAMNCMLQAFQRYVAIVLYGYCKSRSGMLHMLHML
jgi:hypothetical protein